MRDGHDATPIVSDFSDDPEMTELVDMFVSELPDRIQALERSWRADALEDTRRIAHRLKGASGGYGFATLGDQAAALESALKAPTPDLTTARAELDRLIEMCSRAAR